MSFTLYNGDSLKVLQSLPNDSIDAVVTDPPYGLSTAPDMVEVMRHWLAGDDYAHAGGGFMGNAWDSFVPGPSVWRECLRVLKPGGHLLSFFGSRTYDLGALAIRLAGFDVRDQLMWLYGSGFPKGHNLKGDWQGWGSAIKPAHEPIVMARKPFKKTLAANVADHGVGALNIDGCRVGAVPGRWPANVLHDGSDEVMAAFPDARGQQGALTGNEPSGKMGRANCYGVMDRRYKAVPRIDDTASAARFFYCAKASRRDRSPGNTHPTVKPTDLMAWLCRLVTPPGGVVLDPFMGSGSTGKAALLERFRFTGIELDAGYFDIARKRMVAALKESSRSRSVDQSE